MRLRTVYRIIGLLVLLLGSLGIWESLGAQEERAIRRIVVAEREAAEAIRQQVQQGASFSALARAKSQGAEYTQWGYSGIVQVNEVQPAMRTALLQLQEGQISDVLPLDGQFVLLKVISPKIPRHLEAAERAENAKQLPQALQEIQSALKLEADNVQAYIKLGLVYQGMKQFDEAIRSFDKARQYAPQEAQVALLAATALMHAAVDSRKAAQVEQALAAFQQVVQLDSRYAPSADFGIGKLYLLALRQPAKAVSYLEKAAEAVPSVPDVHRLLIQAYYDTQRYEQAWQSMRRAQDLGFDFPDLLAVLHKVKQHSQR